MGKRKKYLKDIIIGVLAVALVVVTLLYIAKPADSVLAPESGSGSLPPVSSATSSSVVSSSEASAPAPPEESSSVVLPSASEPEPVEDNIPLEIERKFLVDIESLPPQMDAPHKQYYIEQTYISIEPEVRIRRINGNSYYFALKLPRDETGLSRAEIDFIIDERAYNELVQMAIGTTILKTRYQFYEGDTYVYLDVYDGELEGLAVVEVQFESEQQANAFQPPEWFGPDVTSDKRYKNAQLAMNGMPEPRLLEDA